MPHGYVCMVIHPTHDNPTTKVYYSEVPLTLGGSLYSSSRYIGSHTHGTNEYDGKKWIMKYFGINMLAWVMRLRSAINYRGPINLSSSESSIRQAVGNIMGNEKTGSGSALKGKPIQYFSVNRFGGKVAVAYPAF